MENTQSSSSSHMNAVCVGLVGFDSVWHGLICKEFCLADCDSIYVYHKTVKTPKLVYEYFCDLEWSSAEDAISYQHGLDLHCGDIELNELIREVYPKMSGKKVIVSESWQVDWLKYTFRECGPIDCEIFNPRNRSSIYSTRFGMCHYHKLLLDEDEFPNRFSYRCAHRVAQDLRKVAIDRSKTDSVVCSLQNCTLSA